MKISCLSGCLEIQMWHRDLSFQFAGTCENRMRNRWHDKQRTNPYTALNECDLNKILELCRNITNDMGLHNEKVCRHDIAVNNLWLRGCVVDCRQNWVVHCCFCWCWWHFVFPKFSIFLMSKMKEIRLMRLQNGNMLFGKAWTQFH